MAQSLLTVRKLKWIVVEDSNELDPHVADLLNRKNRSHGLNFVYIAIPTDSSDQCRGSTQRNAGLQWLLQRTWPMKSVRRQLFDRIRQKSSQEEGGEVRTHSETRNLGQKDVGQKDVGQKDVGQKDVGQKDRFKMPLPQYLPDSNTSSSYAFLGSSDGSRRLTFRHPGVIYLADDDNSYDSELFDEIRKINSVGLFPVGLVSKTALSTPIVDQSTGSILGFYDGWISNRTWPVDMAGFAVSMEYMHWKNANMSHWNIPLCDKSGTAETSWLSKFGRPSDNVLEAMAHNGTRVLVWHTQTVRANFGEEIIAGPFKTGTNLEELEVVGLTKRLEKPQQ